MQISRYIFEWTKGFARCVYAIALEYYNRCLSCGLGTGLSQPLPDMSDTPLPDSTNTTGLYLTVFTW